MQNSMEPLEYTLGKLRRTQRPKRDELGQLLAEIKALPATVEDEAMLERLLVKCDRWAVSVLLDVSRVRHADLQPCPANVP